MVFVLSLISGFREAWLRYSSTSKTYRIIRRREETIAGEEAEFPTRAETFVANSVYFELASAAGKERYTTRAWGHLDSILERV